MKVTPVFDEGRAAGPGSAAAAPVKYGAASWWLTVLCIVLAVLVAVAAGGRALLRRADAYSALASAKTVRFALASLSTEAYAEGRPFFDPAQQGGVAEGLYAEALLRSAAPGDFQLLQTEGNGYGVVRFTYTEGEITVAYLADPTTWTVTAAVPILETGTQSRVQEG